MSLVRKCDKCGAIDARTSWRSAEQAAKEGAFDRWACPTCAWPEFDLVEQAKEPVQTS
jgi:hypothetical protein